MVEELEAYVLDFEPNQLPIFRLGSLQISYPFCR
jgi:hypothetical protein